MTESKKVFLLDAAGNTVAEFLIADEEEGWLTGKLVWQRFPGEAKNALAWYDEVVQGQMLSYLDEAEEAVQGLGLRAAFPDGSTHKPYSLHVGPSNEVSFRVCPVLPPPELPGKAIRG